MPLTKAFTETIRARLQESRTFRRGYLREAVNCFLSGETETAKTLLRDYINGTIGFIQLGADLDRSPKTLMRMFSPSGNPQARNLFAIIAHLQKLEGTVLEVVERKAA
jgi:hypothetical protein